MENGAALSARDALLQTPLHVAIGLGDLDTAEYLLENGAETGAYNFDGTRRWCSRARRTTWRAVELLMAHGADPHVRTPDGGSLLKLLRRAGRQQPGRVLVPR